MRSHLDSSNKSIYLIVRANIMAAVKGSYFVDSPNHIVRKIDRQYMLDHQAEQNIFLEHLVSVLDEMKKEFYYDIGEYERIRDSIDGLKKYLIHKIENVE